MLIENEEFCTIAKSCTLKRAGGKRWAALNDIRWELFYRVSAILMPVESRL